MPLSITFPDKIINKCRKVAPKNVDIRDFVVETVSSCVDEISKRKNDPFFKFLEKNRNLKNNENLTDISENHDKYIY